MFKSIQVSSHLPSSNSFLLVSASIVTINIYHYYSTYIQETNRVLSELQPPLSDEFNFKGFMAYILTTAGVSRNKATANSIVVDLIRFYEVTTQSSKDCFGKIDTLLTRSNLEAFLEYIREENIINQQQLLNKYGDYNLLLNTSWI